MPLTKKGSDIMSNMKSEYGDRKGESVFYASKNAGNISGVEARERLREAGRGLARRLGRRKRG